ncbi:MAG TPA: DUF2085 domain-containing protein [Nitrolancea sp.]|nr:DUF2085 domain-containing protein [Nitrolancea sp.]
MGSSAKPVSASEERIIIAVDRAIYHVARHWVWLLNIVGALFVGLPTLAPVLDASGHKTLAEFIYRPFSLICHQVPDRSFHIFGYKMAYCERCFAIYAGTLVLGLIFGMSKRKLRPATLLECALISVPMAIDGFTQLFGWRQSTWELRVVTGSIFAFGVAWLMLPRLERGFQEIQRTVDERFERLVREGRAAPL